MNLSSGILFQATEWFHSHTQLITVGLQIPQTMYDGKLLLGDNTSIIMVAGVAEEHTAH